MLRYYAAQLSAAWQVKIMLAVIITVFYQIVEQFCRTFEADAFLVYLLLILTVIDTGLGIAVHVKKRDFGFTAAARAIFKLPLVCLYLFLVGAMGVSVHHSIKIGLPLLDIFVSYLIATESFIIIGWITEFGVTIPPLLLYLLNGFRERMEGAIKHLPGNANKADGANQTTKAERTTGQKP